MRTDRLAPALASFALLALAATSVGCSAGADEPSSTATSASGPGGGEDGGSGGAGGAGATGSVTVSGSSGTGSFGGEACGETTFGNAVPASLLIVLDKSGSMAGGDGQPDKWAPTVAAMTQLTQTAPPELKVGLTPFPAGECDWDAAACANFESPSCQAALADGCCQDVSPAPAVPVQPLSQSGPLIVSWLNGNGPGGGTPTLWALKRGYNVMKTLTTPGERFVLLVTDGDPNVYQPAQNVGGFSIPESNIECKTTEDIIAEAATAATTDPPVKTYVIGSPGVSFEGMQFLSGVSDAGLTAPDDCDVSSGNCHFQIGTADFQADLQEALELIAGQISDCVFALPEGEDVDPDLVNVVIETPDGPVEVYRDPTHTDGWDYTDATQTKIQLFGPPCELYQSLAGNTITIILGCETILK